MTSRENGFYWIRHIGSGLTIAEFHSGSWRVPGFAPLLKDMQVEVLSERIRFPVSPLAERIVDVVLKTVSAEPMEGENAELVCDRDELAVRIEAILREGPKP